MITVQKDGSYLLQQQHRKRRSAQGKGSQGKGRGTERRPGRKAGSSHSHAVDVSSSDTANRPMGMLQESRRLHPRQRTSLWSRLRTTALGPLHQLCSANSPGKWARYVQFLASWLGMHKYSLLEIINVYEKWRTCSRNTTLSNIWVKEVRYLIWWSQPWQFSAPALCLLCPIRCPWCPPAAAEQCGAQDSATHVMI